MFYVSEYVRIKDVKFSSDGQVMITLIDEKNDGNKEHIYMPRKFAADLGLKITTLLARDALDHASKRTS